MCFLSICKGDPKPEGKFLHCLAGWGPHFFFFFPQSSLNARTQGYKPGRVGSIVRNVLPLPLTLVQMSTRLSKLAFLLVSLFFIDSLFASFPSTSQKQIIKERRGYGMPFPPLSLSVYWQSTDSDLLRTLCLHSAACLSCTPSHFYPGQAKRLSFGTLCLHSYLFPGHSLRCPEPKLCNGLELGLISWIKILQQSPLSEAEVTSRVAVGDSDGTTLTFLHVLLQFLLDPLLASTCFCPSLDDWSLFYMHRQHKEPLCGAGCNEHGCVKVP